VSPAHIFLYKTVIQSANASHQNDSNWSLFFGSFQWLDVNVEVCDATVLLPSSSEFCIDVQLKTPYKNGFQRFALCLFLTKGTSKKLAK